MKTLTDLAQPISATAVLSGLGSLEREEICAFLALLEETDSISLAKGAIEDLGRRTKIFGEVSTRSLDDAKNQLMRSPAPDAVLRHRMWVHLADALSVPVTVTLSRRSARRAAAALAVRASERLTPSVIAQRKKKEEVRREDLVALIGMKADDFWKAGRNLISRNAPIPFPDLVREEILNVLADEEFLSAALKQADPEIKEALRKSHGAAQKAIAAGGGWVMFAAIAGNAGFLPYLLAAQLSAWIPLVSGPALVSLLATLINPVTVAAGVGTLGWLAMGKGSKVVRSQVAARICVLLAIPGSQRGEEGLASFLADMRSLDRVPTTAFGHLPKRDRKDLRTRLSLVSGRLLSALPAPAGSPPPPWGSKRDINDLTDAALVASLTAGEMFWHAAAIDENVLKAADFSRAADLGDPISFAVAAQSFVFEGAGYSLRGYTAERLVLDTLVANGHDVTLAEASNTPGLDLIVDGSPVQVKCGTELSNLTEHFEKYPAIPVIANKELADKAAESGQDWADMVTTLPGFQIDAVEEQIAEALGHAAELADPDILEFALSMGVLRGGLEVAQGKIPVSDLPAWLLLDGASRGMLSLVGAKAGGWLGLVVVGPAGALVLGPAIGCAALMGNSGIKTAAQKILMREWLRELLEHGADLHGAIKVALERRIHHLSHRSTKFGSTAPNQSQITRWMIARSQDDLIAVLEDHAQLGSRPAEEAHCIELLFKAPDLAPTDAAVLQAASGLRRHFAKKPGLQELLVDRQLEGVGDFFGRHVRRRLGFRSE